MARIRFTTTNRSAEEVQVQSVVVRPSAADWVVVIEDTAGKVVFEAEGNTATSFYALIQDDWVGCNCTTATNIESIIIYTR